MDTKVQALQKLAHGKASAELDVQLDSYIDEIASFARQKQVCGGCCCFLRETREDIHVELEVECGL